MDTIEDIVLKFNDLLETDPFDPEIFGSLMTKLNELCKSGIILLDFEFHSEEKLECARFWKIRKTKLENYELAYNMRELEKECLKYLEFKKQYRLEKSTFVLIHDFIIYACFGTAKNDWLIRGLLSEANGIENSNIGYLIQRLNEP